jgi:hypothetical protein
MESVKRRLNQYIVEPEGNKVSAGAEESPLLKTVTSKRLMENVTD